MLCPLCQFYNPADAKRCRSCGTALSVQIGGNGAAPDALPDETLLAGAYAVEGVLGQGGFGITYRCHDQMLDRAVAVKEFFPSGCRRQNAEVQASRGLSGDSFREARAQFLAEARTLARCHHVGIVGVYAAFEANETAYMVMELLHGNSLAQLLTEHGGRMNEAEAVGIIERVGEALQFVHELGLLHRDIKPDNIIVCDDGRVMLIDFGTARETIQDQVQGQTVMVTPGYAPLEQYARQAKRGAFTDVYSLAATLHHLLTGQMPPAASDRAMGVVLREVREFNPNVSASVAHATQSALQMEIARRPQSVREFLDLLHVPIEEAEVESFFYPQLINVPFDEDHDDEELASDEIPVALAPDVLRAQQQSWQNVMPAANAQPVQLAPSRDFSAPKAPMTHGNASGGVRLPGNSTMPDAFTRLAWWIFAIIIGVSGFIYLVSNQRPAQRNSPSYYNGPRISSPMNSLSSEGRRRVARLEKQREGQRVWNGLPILMPVSVKTLPSESSKFAAETKRNGAANSQSNYLVRDGAVAFSPNGKRLAYIDGQSVLHVLSLPDQRIVRSLELDKSRTSAKTLFSPNNETIAITRTVKIDSANHRKDVDRVEVWNLRTGQRTGTFITDPQEKYLWLQAVLNDGQLLLRTRARARGVQANSFCGMPKLENAAPRHFCPIRIGGMGSYRPMEKTSSLAINKTACTGWMCAQASNGQSIHPH